MTADRITLCYTGHTHPVELPIVLDGPPRRSWRLALNYAETHIAPSLASFTLVGPDLSVRYLEGAPEPADLAALDQKLRGPSLLILDDHPAMCRLLRRILEQHNYRVSSAHSFDGALSEAATRRFDGLVLDFRLGGGRTGTELLQELRTWPQYAHVPAVACTAYWDTEVEALAGFDSVIGKPYKTHAVLTAITAAFVRRSLPVARHEGPA